MKTTGRNSPKAAGWRIIFATAAACRLQIHPGTEMSVQTQTITGIVIKEIKTKESDKIITVLSKELGVINIYVKGAMRLKNKFHSATGLFTYSEFVIFRSRSSDLYQLNEASVKHIFHALSSNVEYLALAMYMSELVCEVSVPNDMNNEILRLYLNTLHMLTTGKWQILLCKAAFEMRLMCDTGFRPDLLGCKTCGEYDKDIFFIDVENGDVVCTTCMKSYQTDRLIMEKPAMLAMRYFAYADLDKMFSFTVSDFFARHLALVRERYVLRHTKPEYKTLQFFKSLQSQEI